MQLIWDDKDWCYLEAGKGKDGLALLGPSYKAAGPHFAFHFEEKKEVENIYSDLKKSGVKVAPFMNIEMEQLLFICKIPKVTGLKCFMFLPLGLNQIFDYFN